MKIMSIGLALTLLAGVSGLATANPPGDPESAFVLDLTAAGGSSYHLHCDYNAALSNCHNPSLWQNTNKLRGLQTGNALLPDGSLDNPDTPLLS